MADYKFDGKRLTYKYNRMAEIDGKYIRDKIGNRVGEIDGQNIKDKNGNRVAEFTGDVLKDRSGSRIATMSDIRKQIDGNGGTSVAALWWFFIR